MSDQLKRIQKLIQQRQHSLQLLKIANRPNAVSKKEDQIKELCKKVQELGQIIPECESLQLQTTYPPIQTTERIENFRVVHDTAYANNHWMIFPQDRKNRMLG